MLIRKYSFSLSVLFLFKSVGKPCSAQREINTQISNFILKKHFSDI